jgi:hypothetical protein
MFIVLLPCSTATPYRDSVAAATGLQQNELLPKKGGPYTDKQAIFAGLSMEGSPGRRQYF